MNLAAVRRFSIVALLVSALFSLSAEATEDLVEAGLGDGASAAVLEASASFPLLLYKVDFEPPLHTLGAPPAIGEGSAPRYTPTRLRYGDPLVAASTDPRKGQALELTQTVDPYDQVSFEFASNLGGGGFDDQYPTYYVELTVTIASAGADSSGFTILLDGPRAQQIVFAPNGVITALASWDPDAGLEGYRTAIGRFDVGVPTRVGIKLDAVSGQWEIFLDRNLALSGRYPLSCAAHFAGQCIRSLRVNAVGSTRALIDDVVVMDHELELDVRIRRTKDSNVVVPHSLMLVEVILIGSEIIDIARADPDSLRLGPGSATIWKIVKQQDVNHDGFEDLIVRFRANDTGIELNAEEACLEGEVDEVPFYTCNVIRTPPRVRTKK
ncbi:MAG: hypothetical protein JRE38_07800 [Deltaproteobacteria bacterium]|nr:hypothetical protein [Deltaproteobacteria bacterium]MBW2692634.1 hypothetical protein [Deltaproteobacteria bacterium]